MSHSHTSTRPLRATALATSVALAVAACGSGDEDGGTGNGDAASTDTVTIDLSINAVALDPIANSLLIDHQISSLVFSTLYTFAQGSATETEPVLAEDMTASDDGMVHEITLKPDLAFSDGSPLTSADVVASIDRLRSSEGPNAGDVAFITDVSAPDESTVVIELSRPEGNLGQTLALPSMAIVPAAAADDPEYFSGDPLFSGPYLPEGDTTSTDFALVRNEEYTGPTPVVDRLEFSVIGDPVASSTRLQGDEVDFSIVPHDQLGNFTGDVTGESVPGVASLWILPNNRPDTLFGDVRIRQALALAIDREALAPLAYGESAVTQSGPFPVVADYPHTVEVYPEPDLDRARELLQGTACADGCEFSATYFASAEAVDGRVAVALQQQLAPLGMTVNPQPVEGQTFIQNSLDGTYELNISVSGGFNVPSSLSGALDTGPAGCIYTGCVNEEAAPAIDALFAATSEEEATEAADELLRIYEEWTPVIPVSGTAWHYGVRGDLGDVIGLQPTALFWIGTE